MAKKLVSKRAVKRKTTETINKKKKYMVRTRFIFTGTVKVLAENVVEARRIVKENFNAVMRGENIKAASEVIIDWKFPLHPEKQTTMVKEVKRAVRKKTKQNQKSK